jgi:hypothetical protein
MAFFRSYVAPFLIVLVFLAAMLAVSARAFLPGDMSAPAPIEAQDLPSQTAPTGSAAPAVSMLLHGVAI